MREKNEKRNIQVEIVNKDLTAGSMGPTGGGNWAHTQRPQARREEELSKLNRKQDKWKQEQQQNKINTENKP